MTPAQYMRLCEYAKVKPHDEMASLLVSIGGPWSRQINEALVKRGYLQRHPTMPGLCFITPAGIKALEATP